MEATTANLIQAYINIRDAIELKRKAQAEELKGLEDTLQVVEDELLVRCKEGNISVPGVGRVHRRVTQNYWTNDWNSFYKIVKEHDAFHLLHQRIANKAMKTFLEDNPDLTPPGLNVDSKYAITVTRA
jgi:hypothetical protein